MVTLCAATSFASAHGLGVFSGGPAVCSTPWDRRWGLFSWPSGKIVYLVLEKLWPREEKSESGWQIRNWLQEILDELGPHSVLPRLCPEGGGTGRVGCSRPSGLCPACRKAQSKVLIKAAVRKQECPGRQTETPSERCGLCLVPTCLKAFHKCVVQRWG